MRATVPGWGWPLALAGVLGGVAATIVFAAVMLVQPNAFDPATKTIIVQETPIGSVGASQIPTR